MMPYPPASRNARKPHAQLPKQAVGFVAEGVGGSPRLLGERRGRRDAVRDICIHEHEASWRGPHLPVK